MSTTPWVAEPHPLPPGFGGDPDLHGWWDIHEVGHSASAVPIAIVDHHRDGHNPTRAQAAGHARLIAASPDLFDGCNALLGLLQLIIDRDDMPAALREAILNSHRVDEARAAVIKAGNPMTSIHTEDTASPKLEALYRAELAKLDAIAPVLRLITVPVDLRKPPEAYRTERVLPKAVMDAGGNWITEQHVLTRTERGLSDSPANRQLALEAADNSRKP